MAADASLRPLTPPAHPAWAPSRGGYQSHLSSRMNPLPATFAAWDSQSKRYRSWSLSGAAALSDSIPKVVPSVANGSATMWLALLRTPCCKNIQFSRACCWTRAGQPPVCGVAQPAGNTPKCWVHTVWRRP